MEVLFFVMQITHTSEPNEALSKKQKIKFRKTCFANVVSDLKKKCLIGRKSGSSYLSK